MTEKKGFYDNGSPVSAVSVADAPRTLRVFRQRCEQIAQRNMELRTAVRILTEDRCEWIELADRWVTAHYELRAKIADLVAMIALRGGAA